jgi:hypothetical protein
MLFGVIWATRRRNGNKVSLGIQGSLGPKKTLQNPRLQPLLQKAGTEIPSLVAEVSLSFMASLFTPVREENRIPYRSLFSVLCALPNKSLFRKLAFQRAIFAVGPILDHYGGFPYDFKTMMGSILDARIAGKRHASTPVTPSTMIATGLS